MEEDSTIQGRSPCCCFLRWMNLQEQDLTELLQALDLNGAAAEDGETDRTFLLTQLVEKGINHFQEYATQRANLAGEDAAPYFSPAWCSSLERSMLWAGGCRPSIFIRLVYALSGKEIVTRLDEFLQGNSRFIGLGDLSASQLSSINSLQMETIKQEEKLTTKLAGLQEEIADEPIAFIAKEVQVQQYDETSGEAEGALNALAASLKSVLEEADKQRIDTLKELTTILTPIQSVDFLAMSKKLHLCIHAWGKKRDQEHRIRNVVD